VAGERAAAQPPQAERWKITRGVAFSRANRQPKHAGPRKMKAKFKTMKRIKDSEILPLITAPANLRQSIFKVLEGTARKDSKQGREILAHIDQIEKWLAAE
jgi:hypothetical protein